MPNVSALIGQVQVLPPEVVCGAGGGGDGKGGGGEGGGGDGEGGDGGTQAAVSQSTVRKSVIDDDVELVVDWSSLAVSTYRTTK
jgi:hypothetical protein